MSIFEKGDRVVEVTHGIGTVTDIATYAAVKFDNGMFFAVKDDALSFAPPPPRDWAVGEYVRISSGQRGYIFADDGDAEDCCPYSVALIDSDDEATCSSEELTIWSPEVGERVIETGDPDLAGTVLNASVTTDLVEILWDGFPHGQTFDVNDLEPADERDTDLIKVNDRVAYSNPFFVGIEGATVDEVREDCIRVSFDNKRLPDGFYHQDFFEKIAA